MSAPRHAKLDDNDPDDIHQYHREIFAVGDRKYRGPQSRLGERAKEV